MQRSLHDYLTGGPVRGPGTATSDSILARLSNGEYVLPKAAVDQVGVENLEAIRQAALAKAPRMRLGGPISTLADKAVQAAIARPHAVKNTVVGSLLENTLGIGTGLGGLAAGMTRSAPAQAAVLDNTQTQEYQQAQDAIRQGRGNEPTNGIFGLKGILAGPTPAETVRELEQQQAIQDEQYRQLVGGPTPTEQRMLQDMNRASVKGYKLGGPISGGLNIQDEQDPTSTTLSATTPSTLNSYGNDMSLANRMNAGAEQMRLMREGPAKPKEPDYMGGLKSLLSLLGSQPQNQNALGNTDVLGGLNNLLDQKQVPGMAQGVLIGQEQWERLPRFGWGQLVGGGHPTGTFADISDRYTDDMAKEQNRAILEGVTQPFKTGAKALWDMLPDSATTQMKKTRARLQAKEETQPLIRNRMLNPEAPSAVTPINIPKTDAEFLRQIYTNPIGASPIGDSAVGAGDNAANPSISPSSSQPMTTRELSADQRFNAQKGVLPPTYSEPVATGLAEGLADANARSKALLPQLSKLDAIANANASRLAATDYANQSPGRAVINNAPGSGIGPQAVVAAPSRPIGTQPYTTGQPFEPSQVATGPLTTGGSAVPTYQTDYTVFGPKGQQGTMSVTGPDQRVGGGTVSQPDQGNGGTVEGNVAALNRQIDAMRSLREARNPGITTGGSALPEAPAPVDIWARPGDSFGDSQFRQARFEGLLESAGKQRGFGAKRRAAAMIDAATGMLAPFAATAKLNADQRQANNSLAGQLAQARAQQEASKYGADVGLVGHKYTADATLTGSRLKAEQEAMQNKTKNDIDLANAQSNRMTAMARTQLPAKEQTLLQLVDAYSKLDPKFSEGQRLKLLIDTLNPPKDQASLVDEIAKLKAQESQ